MASSAEDEIAGLSFREARTRLLDAYRLALETVTPTAQSSNRFAVRHAFLLAVIAVYALAVLTGCSSEFYPGMIFCVLFVCMIIAVDVSVGQRYDYVESHEVEIQLQHILRSFHNDIHNDESDYVGVPAAGDNGILSGSAQSSICTAYRNGSWHRLPSLLLCEGDIVALMAGDSCPCRVIELLPELEGPRRVWRLGDILDEGDKVLLSSSAAPSTGDRHRVIFSDSAELLAISGDIRCYQLLETPVFSYVSGILEAQRRRGPEDKSSLHQLFEIVDLEKTRLAAVLLVMFILAAAVRLGAIDEAPREWALSTALPLVCGILCFVACPDFYCILAEVLVTSDFLAMIEVDLQLAQSSSPTATQTTTNPIHVAALHERTDSTEQFDDDDIEERVEESAAEISSRVTTKRWVHYLYHVFCKRMGLEETRELDVPIPFIHSRLLEVLGSITFVAFVDDDVICEGFSIVEELFLLKNTDTADAADSSKGLVLDLHANSQATGSRFESPNWWKHLASLKPIGLNALLTYAPSPLNTDISRYSRVKSQSFGSALRGEGHSSKPKSRVKVPLSVLESQLISHVRRPIPFESLRELSDEIGFCAEDVAGFTRMLEVNMLVPRLVDRKLLEDTHAWGQEETRRRGTLVPELRGVIAHDASNDSLQMMVHGTPVVLLNYCKEYWDGATITSLDEQVKKEVLSVYDRWNLEDFDVVAFAYSPVPAETHAIVRNNYEHNLRSPLGPDESSAPHSSVLFFVDPSTRYLGKQDKKAHVATKTPAITVDTRSDPADATLTSASSGLTSAQSPSPAFYRRKRSSSEPTVLHANDLYPGGDLPFMAATAEFPLEGLPSRHSVENMSALETSLSLDMLDASLISIEVPQSTMSPPKGIPFQKSRSFDDERIVFQRQPSPSVIFEAALELDVTRSRSQTNAMAPTRVLSERLRNSPRRPVVSRVASLDGGEKRRRREPRNLFTSVFPIMKHQVFLGMAASSVPVRQGVSQLMEDLTDAGVRFIYFSPRNMRRSKPVAAKIGIPFDWNCAISLRELADDENDPFRHISSYADWDVHARMPHGVRAIRRHLEEVDNVPLLVSLYTDATPSSIRDIITVFREHGEVVLTIGTSYRLSNRDIFSASNLACGVSMLPGEHAPISSSESAAIKSLPSFSSTAICRPDMLLVFRLINLNSPSLLQLPSLMSSSSAESKDNLHINLSSPLDFSTLLEAVRVGRIFLLNATQALAVLCIAIVALAMCPLLAMLSPLSLPPCIPPAMILLFLFVYIPAIVLSMLFTRVSTQDTVMKNTPRKRNLVRKPKDEMRFKMYMLSRCLFVASSILLLQWVSVAAIYGGSADFSTRLQLFYTSGLDQDASLALSKYWLVQDLDSAALLLAILSQSSTLLHRGQLFPQFPSPMNSLAYCVAVVLCLLFHGTLLLLRASLRPSGFALYASLHWGVWVTLVAPPAVGVFVGFAVNHFDNKNYRRHLQFLRLEFDTKLGMHSPR